MALWWGWGEQCSGSGPSRKPACQPDCVYKMEKNKKNEMFI